jgi:uncharacterized Zn finger protein
MPFQKIEGESMDDWYFDRKPKREAKGGIKAKSKRGKIGETWWSEAFIRVLESFDIGGRLGRGRSYARSGQVMDLKIKSGSVTSKVQGSEIRPYRVSIEIKPLSDDDWSRAEQAMADQAIFMAKLLAGEMPHEIEEAFRGLRLTLFPGHKRDLKTECSCPDWSNPCKHIAATYYILAEKFDEDPFLIFTWRGRTKEQIIERLRALRGAIPSQNENEAALEPQGLMLAEDFAPLAERIADFWKVAPNFFGLRIRPQMAEVPDGILRQLGPAQIEVKGRDIADLLAPAYQAMTEKAAVRALDDSVSGSREGDFLRKASRR